MTNRKKMNKLTSIPEYPGFLDHIVAVSEILELCFCGKQCFCITITLDNNVFFNVPRFIHSSNRELQRQGLTQLREQLIARLPDAKEFT